MFQAELQLLQLQRTEVTNLTHGPGPSHLQAILAEFLLPVNRTSLDARNSMSLFTSSSVTAGGGVRGQHRQPPSHTAQQQVLTLVGVTGGGRVLDLRLEVRLHRGDHGEEGHEQGKEAGSGPELNS